MRVGDIIGLVCFGSLALLGWWVLAHGISWAVALVGLWWLALGGLATVQPDEWKKRGGGR
jgi:hypothetical protein